MRAPGEIDVTHLMPDVVRDAAAAAAGGDLRFTLDVEQIVRPRRGSTATAELRLGVERLQAQLGLVFAVPAVQLGIPVAGELPPGGPIATRWHVCSVTQPDGSSVALRRPLDAWRPLDAETGVGVGPIRATQLCPECHGPPADRSRR